MKQTAVEWLENEFQEMCKDFGGLHTDFIERFEQAKVMEKEQIKMCCIKTMETCNSDMNELGCKTMDDYFNYIYKETLN